MDWDNDGKIDLLVGDTNGNVQIYLNTNTNRSPIFSSGSYVLANRSKLDASGKAAPVTDDWNGDGKTDLIVGSMDGRIRIYLNIGTPSLPSFTSPFFLQLNGKEFDIGSRSAPRITDWNKDGLNDLLIGEMDGHIYYLKNTGTKNMPLFNKAEKLYIQNGDLLKYPGTTASPRSRLSIADWNNDGFDDILAGGSDGRTVLYLTDPEPSLSLRAFINRTWNQTLESGKKLKNALLKLKMRIQRTAYSAPLQSPQGK